MAELVGGAFLSAALQVAFERLASSDIIDYFRGRKLNDSLLEKLEITLLSVNQVLEDAEERQYENPYVKKWLDKLKDAVYVAEDLLDEIALEATRQKLEAESQTATSKVWDFFTSFANPFDKKIELRIQQVLENLEYLAKQKDVLGLKEGSGGGNEIRDGGEGSPTSCLVDESRIYGRDVDKEKIIKFLLSDNESGNRLSVISIVGLGGMGKTTLAQLVYNDKRMEDQFQLKVWVCISEGSDVVRITKSILAELKCSTEGHENLNSLQLKLKEKLMGKKILLVLDDAWKEDNISWEDLLVPFLCGVSETKILVTTRHEKVAPAMHSIQIHHLQQLQDEDGWKLFVKYAFNDKDAGMYRNLESIGIEIVRKCQGFPLAIKALGSLLHRELSEQYWRKILKSDIWKLADDDARKILPTLRLSYHYLSSNLKRCFAFCSIFPKNYEINKDFLIQLWMSEDLLHCNQGYKSAYEMGENIINDLQSRSFFQSTHYDGHFTMRDLVNDLAKSVSGEFCLQLEGGGVQKTSTKVRHISFLVDDFIHGQRLGPINKCESLRSLLLLQRNRFVTRGCSVLLDLSQFKYLRSLSLRGCQNVQELVSDMSKLEHLCYLDLSSTSIVRLDNSICQLQNLHTLILEDCGSLTELPPNFHKLINMGHLNLRRSKIREMPMQMAMLENIQILTDFFVGSQSGTDIMSWEN